MNFFLQKRHQQEIENMIIDFTVSNFRSIRERQTFSLLAESASSHLSESIIKPGNGEIGILKTAGIYGANASGKSNLLQAFWALRYLVCLSGDLKDGDPIPCYEPFRLSESTKRAATEFEIEFFLKDKLRFIYSVSFNSNKIISESLDFYPSRSKANIFKRSDSDKWDDVKFGTNYKKGKRKFAFFDNNTYISKAGNSADAPELIRSIFNYFRTGIFKLGVNEQVEILRWKENHKLVDRIALILKSIDFGINGISFRERDPLNIKLPDNMPEFFRKTYIDSMSKETIFLHRGENGIQEEFTEKMESAGTIKIFHLLPLLLGAFQDGGVLIIDELDNSFHPHIAELIIKLFNDPKININNAQLIFSTHNIVLMSAELLRRDQIWLTEKKDGETKFYSLDDFDKSVVKMDSPFSKWYEEGRFGAIPSIDILTISEILKDGS